MALETALREPPPTLRLLAELLSARLRAGCLEISFDELKALCVATLDEARLALAATAPETLARRVEARATVLAAQLIFLHLRRGGRWRSTLAGRDRVCPIRDLRCVLP